MKGGGKKLAQISKRGIIVNESFEDRYPFDCLSEQAVAKTVSRRQHTALLKQFPRRPMEWVEVVETMDRVEKEKRGKGRVGIWRSNKVFSSIIFLCTKMRGRSW